MRTLAAVDEARAVMTKAADWGVFRWLLEKGRVQEIADRATAALVAADRRVKAHWSDALKMAYQELLDREKDRRAHPQENDHKNGITPEIRLVARRVKEAYDEGQRARVQAESTIDEAESRKSTDHARTGCREALESYDLRERAIRKAEAANSHRYSASVSVTDDDSFLKKHLITKKFSCEI
jgi:hypothetical protein